jgi:hypothetical protein
MKIAGHAHMKAVGHAFQPKINKHRRRQALGGGADLQGGGDGGRYIPAAAGPKGCTRSAMKIGLRRKDREFSRL